MPDINLLENTERPEEKAGQRPIPPHPELSDPSATKQGLGGMFRSLFGQKASSEKQVGQMSVRTKQKTGERILSEKRSDAPAPMIPLPDDDDGFTINLLNEEIAGRYNPRQKILKLVFVALGSVALIVVAGFGLSFYEQVINKDVAATKVKIDAVRSSIEGLREDTQTVQTVTQRVKAVTTLLDNHIHWTQFFEKLEQYTLPSVTYGASFSGTLQGTVSLSAKTDTYEHVAQQYLVLQQAVKNGDFISSFTITSATRREGKDGAEVNFSVSMVLIPTIFTQKTKTASAISLTDSESALCYLRAHPTEVANFPTQIQGDFTPNALPVTAATCDVATAVQLDRGRTLLTTDSDRDTLVDFLELLTKTSAVNPDTDLDGQTDAQEVLSCQNPNGTGALSTCDPLHPIVPAL